MEWLTTLQRSGGVSALARQLGAAPADVSAGVAALLPGLLSGLRRVSEASGGGDAGAAAIVDLFSELGGGELAIDVMGPAPLDVERGNVILERVLGPEVSRRAVLQEAVRRDAVAPELAVRLLPPLAMLVGGYIVARHVGRVPGGDTPDQPDPLRDTISSTDDDLDRI